MKNPPDENACIRFVKWLASQGIDGIPGIISPAHEVAQAYIQDTKYRTIEEKVDALIRWQVAKCASTGFVTGLGGFLVMPVTLPAGVAAAWIVQAQMVAAMAEIVGAPYNRDQLETLVLICLIGDGIGKVVKGMSIQITTKTLKALIQRIPGKILIEINKRIGFRLLSKAGSKAVINLMKAVPIAGGVVGAIYDGGSCRIVGKYAKEVLLAQV